MYSRDHPSTAPGASAITFASLTASRPICIRYHHTCNPTYWWRDSDYSHAYLIRRASFSLSLMCGFYHSSFLCLHSFNALCLRTLLYRRSTRAQKKDGRQPPRGSSTILRASYPESGDSLPLFFFLTPPRLIHRGRAVRSSGFHPQAARPRPQGSLVRALRSGRVADRPFALHTEAPFRCG